MTQLPIDELRRLTVAGNGALRATPRYNEKCVALVRTDESHIRVFFNRCLGSGHAHGLRLVDLTWDGYVWRVAASNFIPTPHEIHSAKGLDSVGLV